MDTWDYLVTFFCAFEKDDPWWVSIHPVNGDHKTSLIYSLGFEHSVGVQFLLLKEGHSRNPTLLLL
jgi:hypothetical protein